MNSEELVVERRAPFADNPVVGERGARTQRRILEAALDVFADGGYHACSVERITDLAGCSRAAFYQYFAGKDEVFQHLAKRLARALEDVTEALEPISADADGWKQVRRWLEQYGDLYDEYEPLFAAFTSASGADAVVAGGATRVAVRLTADLAAALPERSRSVASVLLNAAARTNRFRLLLGEAEGLDVVRLSRERIDDALADLVHRTAVGPIRDVNVRSEVRARSRRGPVQVPAVASPPSRRVGPAGRETRTRLLAAARDVFAARGYHEARVDDIVTAAGLSHGAFYRYFENKDEVFLLLVGRAGQRLLDGVEALPALELESLRRWLGEWSATYADAAPTVRAWVEAMAVDAELRDQSVLALEQQRRRLARLLDGRGFGDRDAEALVLLGVVDLAEYRGRRTPRVLEALADVVLRGFVPSI